MRMRNALALVLGILLSVSAIAADPAIWSKLQQGGYVILMRHGSVDTMTHSTNPNADFDNCVGQSNLSPQGQQEAALTGRAFKKQHIPIGEVLAGPYCRTQDTARIAFGKVQVWDALDLQTDLTEEEATKRAEAVSARIGQYKGPKNLVLVTHQPNIDVLALELVAPSTMLILKPGGGSDFSVVERITIKDLSQ
jgi:phosphohistidine phosphatase SixA